MAHHNLIARVHYYKLNLNMQVGKMSGLRGFMGPLEDDL
jgi:hypothetical protein